MKRSRIHPSHKTRYRVTNWRAYERGLVERGAITLYFTPEVVRSWVPKKAQKRGAPRKYSDAVIERRWCMARLFECGSPAAA